MIRNFQVNGPTKPKKVVIAKLDGGLGNQFFIYTAAYELAQKLDAEIWLYLNIPLNWPEYFVVRDYALDYYSVKYAQKILDRREYNSYI